MPEADLVAPNRVEWFKLVTPASVFTYLCTFTDIVSSDYCMSVFGERRNREKGLRSAMEAKRQCRKERPTPKTAPPPLNTTSAHTATDSVDPGLASTAI